MQNDVEFILFWPKSFFIDERKYPLKDKINRSHEEVNLQRWWEGSVPNLSTPFGCDRIIRWRGMPLILNIGKTVAYQLLMSAGGSFITRFRNPAVELLLQHLWCWCCCCSCCRRRRLGIIFARPIDHKPQKLLSLSHHQQNG